MLGAAASAINTVAGGGSLISFPSLYLGFGLPSVVANATNSVALWPGSLSGALGYLNQFERTKSSLKRLVIPTVFGSILGAYLLTKTSAQLFGHLVPGLIFLAALILLLQPGLKRWMGNEHGHAPAWLGVPLQFLVAVYGGYFGAGMGIMMLAAFALTLEGDLHELNALKNWLGVAINLVASILFAAQGLVAWHVALPLTLGSLAGGYLSAKVSQRFDPDRMRIAIAIYGVSMSAYFLYRLLVGR